MRHLSLALLAAAVTAACSTYSPPPDADATITITGPVTALYVSDGKTCESRKAVPKDQWSRLRIRSGQPVPEDETAGVGAATADPETGKEPARPARRRARR